MKLLGELNRATRRCVLLPEPLMPDHPTYRVYTPNELLAFSPATFRTAPPPQERLWLGFAFVLLFGVVISGASFAALRYLNVDLMKSRTSLATMPAAPPVTADVAPAPSPVPVVPEVDAPQAETSAAHATALRHRPLRNGRHAPRAVLLPPTLPPPLPPNPF